MLVVNNQIGNHAKEVGEILDGADEITIAVAFLKLGGANRLIPILAKRLSASVQVELFIGTDFFLTEPAALERLLALKEQYSTCKVLIADRASSTFHPKAYVARRGDQYHSLIGSANLTSGGMSTNEELSVYTTHGINDPLTAQLLATFERYRENKKRFQELDPLVLEQYSSRYQINEAERKKFERARDAALPAAFNLRSLEKWHARYLVDRKAMTELADRKRRRREAFKVQKAIAALNRNRIDRNLKATFQEGLRDLMTSNGGRHLWPSSDIHRQGSKALEHPREMIDLFAAAQDAAQRSPREGFETIRNLSKPIPGVGINMATEILCTFAPNRYAVYNGNTAGALRALGIAAPHANFETIGPARYENLCATIKALGARIGSANFPEADAFLNWIYWNA